MDDEVKEIVVVGAGDWVKKQYMPALKPYLERGECRVYILYKYATPERGRVRLVKRYNRFIEQNVTEFQGLGATCLNMENPANEQRITGISPDAVFVVSPDYTHCDVAEEWLKRKVTPIIIEKPFDINPERIRKLRVTIQNEQYNGSVWGFDHYLVRANQFHQMRESLGFDEHMEEQIRKFRFHMLEGTNGTDEGMKNRAPSIQEGMILDMASHTPALVLPFGDPNTIRLDAVKAGIYKPNPAKGINSSGRTIMKSGMETFAEIQFTFKSIFGGIVNATARVGKAVGETDDKYVEVVGGHNGDRSVRLDLSNYYVDFKGGDNPPVAYLFPNPVQLLIRQVMADRVESVALFPPEVGQDIIARLDEWRRPIIDYVRKEKNKLNGYPGGCPLEDILKCVTAL